MRLLVHRGQVLLLLVVGVLAGVAFAGVCLEMQGVSVLAALHVNELFMPARGSPLPAQIVIGGAVAPSTDSGLGDPAAADAAPAVARPTATSPARPTPTASVVPGNVYEYPADEHGGGSGGGGHSGRGG